MKRSTAVALVSILAGCGTAPHPDTGDLLARLAHGNVDAAECRDQALPSLVMRRALALCALGQIHEARRLARLALETGAPTP